tara:strand:- start:661 stop:879 length:219 start_codon:yes stop_codon:yes gene_type:complete
LLVVDLELVMVVAVVQVVLDVMTLQHQFFTIEVFPLPFHQVHKQLKLVVVVQVELILLVEIMVKILQSDLLL